MTGRAPGVPSIQQPNAASRDAPTAAYFWGCEMKGFKACALAFAWAAVCSSPAFATVIFHNTGTTSGWDSINQEHDGTVAQVTSPVFKGSTAVRVTQVYDPSYTGRYHSEVVKNNVYRPGDQGFYGFAFYLPSNWQFVSQTYNLAQFIADFGNTGCDDYMPTTMLWLSGTNLSTRAKSGTPCAQSTQTFSNFASVTAGQWHRIEIQASWQSSASGFLKVWYDGTKKLEQYNIATTVADSQNRAFQFRVGIYANGWHDQGMMVGTQGTRTIHFDQIGAGTVFADADPSGW